MVRLARSYTPRRELGEVYQSKYAAYRRVLDALEPAWPELA
jgi:hypothetical protein